MSEMQKLAKRAVACKYWRWMPGMRVQYIDYGEPTDGHGRYLGLGIQAGDLCVQWEDHAPRGHLGASWSTPQNFRPAPHIFDVVLPDLDDPATLGCLLALVREAWGEPTAHAVPDARGDWYVQGEYVDDEHGRGATEAEALVRALEFKDPNDPWYFQ